MATIPYFGYQRPSGIYVLPHTLGATIQATAEALAQSGEQATPQVLLYVEKRGGFSCRTCLYATPQNASHGRCTIMQGTIHLDDGCCAAWQANPAQLHLYKAPQAS